MIAEAKGTGSVARKMDIFIDMIRTVYRNSPSNLVDFYFICCSKTAPEYL